MITKIQKWGKSQGIRLGKDILTKVDINVGDEVEIEVREGSLVITPQRQVRGKYDLHDLVNKIPDDYQSSEIDWGEPSGKEVW